MSFFPFLRRKKGTCKRGLSLWHMGANTVPKETCCACWQRCCQIRVSDWNRQRTYLVRQFSSTASSTSPGDRCKVCLPSVGETRATFTSAPASISNLKGQACVFLHDSEVRCESTYCDLGTVFEAILANLCRRRVAIFSFLKNEEKNLL